MPAASIRSLVCRNLGSCPECGREVEPDASALPYRGGFYHLVCALWHRECHNHALVGAR
jgi:hypothetical protein